MINRISERLHRQTSQCIDAPVRERPFSTISGLTILRISGLLSARLVLNLREWSDRMKINVSQRADPSANPQQLSGVMLSFHAATVGRLTSSDEFGSDPLDDVRRDLDVHEGEQLADVHSSCASEPANDIAEASGRE